MSTSVDLELFKLLLTRQNYTNYIARITGHILNEETYSLIKDLKVYYKDNPSVDNVDILAFKLWLRTCKHASDKPVAHEIRETMLDMVAEQPEPDVGVVLRYAELDMLDKIVSVVDEIKDGKGKTVDDLVSALGEYDTFKQGETESPLDYEIDADLINTSLLLGDGVSWRIPDLNRAVGQVHKSDFVLITKCPETGGTSFVVSEFTHMLHQLPEGKSAILFHNEEGAHKVAGRILQCALNIRTKDIIADPAGIQKKWEKWKGDRTIKLYAHTNISMSDVERVLRDEEYWLIGINVLDKIEGFYKVEEVERLSKLGAWCRGIANKFGAVFAVVQAPASADRQKWLKQTDVYGNRTKLASESDIMLGIGRTDEEGEEKLRFINVIRNKKPLTGVMEADTKYMKIIADFDHETGRFTQ